MYTYQTLGSLYPLSELPAPPIYGLVEYVCSTCIYMRLSRINAALVPALSCSTMSHRYTLMLKSLTPPEAPTYYPLTASTKLLCLFPPTTFCSTQLIGQPATAPNTQKPVAIN